MNTQKKAIDDYYSQIEQDASGNGEGASKKKVVKLKVKKIEDTQDAPESQENIEPSQGGETKKKFKKIIKQDLTPVKKIETPKKVEQEDSQESEQRPSVVKFQSSFKLVEKKDVVGSKQKQIGSAEFKKSSSDSAGWTKNKPVTKSKPFGKGKKEFSEEEGHRKTKLTPVKEKGKKISIDDDDGGFVRGHKTHKKKEEKKVEDIKQNLVSREGQTVIIPDVLTLKELSEKIGIGLSNLIAEFMKNGMMVTINSKVDFETASIITETFSIKLERDTSSGISVQDIAGGNIQELIKEDDTSSLQERSPVISIMGHVDHGKTSLLDFIRTAKVAAGEAGGITQSIGAYQVDYNGKKITFLDTPGHEAFTIMRARGARSTDIAILVVAADEGVKPQTIESINHAKEAGIPVVVAINKMDKEGANPDMVKSQLSEHGLVPEDWGGDTPMVPVSAHTGFGVDSLLEVILLVAEMRNFKANPNRPGVGTVIESHLDTRLGPIATVLIHTGKIAQGDNIVCKDAFGKIKVLKDYTNTSVMNGGPGDPVLVIGLDKTVEGGDVIQVVSSIDTARQKASEFKAIMDAKKSASSSSLDVIMSKIKSGDMKQLKIVLKADTNGSLEAMRGALLKLSNENTQVQIIHAGVGNVTESDVLMCQGSQAILIGFRVSLIGNVKSIVEDSKVEYISSEVIYHIVERVEKIITGMLDPKEVITDLGKATVGGIFYTSKEFMIVGLKIKDNSIIQKGAHLRLIRDEKIVGNAKINSVKEGVEEVQKYEGPGECGIKYVGSGIPVIGDTIEMYKIEIIK